MALHPDQHALVTNPSNPYQFFEGNDGGVMRSSGQFADVSSWCDGRESRAPPRLARCKQMLSRSPDAPREHEQGLDDAAVPEPVGQPVQLQRLQGGTQDNGTWETYGNPTKWNNTMIGDGGQSGFDAADPTFRFHTFYDAQTGRELQQRRHRPTGTGSATRSSP